MTCERTAGAAVPASWPGRRGARAQLCSLTGRQLRAGLRQPALVAVTLVQTVVWLPLFGSLFGPVTRIPGFGSADYVDYLTPGVATMCVLFSSGWTGLRFTEDMDTGVLERLLASPARRWALVGSSLAYQSVIMIPLVLLVLLVGWLLGAQFRSGLPGVLALLAVTVTLAVAVGALSDALALLVRRREALIAATNFLVLPMTFLSTAMMPDRLLTGWIRDLAWANPANWAATAARDAISADPDWRSVLGEFGALAALAVLATAGAIRAFHRYQRSL